MDKIDPGAPRQKRPEFEQVAADRGAAYARTNDPLKVAARKRAAIYARTALSQEPGGEEFALASQIWQCQLYCQGRGYTVEERHIYSESGSGSIDPRKHPRFASLHEAAQRREFDAVVLVSLDRLSRNQARCAALLDELAQCGVTVECVDGDAAELFLEIKRCAAELERARIAARAAQGRTARKTRRVQQ
jgi:DNA invertase Pin-like site-specific DNA recombinase